MESRALGSGDIAVAEGIPSRHLTGSCCFPELTREMVMRVGDEYHCKPVKQSDIEKLAADAGRSKSLVNRRIPEMADAILAGLNRNSFEHPVVSALKEQIRTER